jgi:uncharacterized membrane protein YhaH (DUF805 family)
MDWYLAVLKKYADFSGRARRKEYWMFALVNLVIAVVLGGVGMAAKPFTWLYILYVVGTFIPSLAVGVRRLHDTGRSGWNWLLLLIPLVGAIILIVFLCQDSAPGDNKYGPNPKMASPMGAVPA